MTRRAWLAVAASLVALAVAGLWMARASDPLAELARIDPPKYVPLVFPALEGDARRAFDTAMARYVKGDYRGAIDGLRPTIEMDLAGSSHARFYLGVCLLLTGDAKGEITELEGLMAVGPAPYIEEAYLYLAKGRLQTGDVKQAREHLEWLVLFAGKYQSQAKELLSQLDRLR